MQYNSRGFIVTQAYTAAITELLATEYDSARSAALTDQLFAETLNSFCKPRDTLTCRLLMFFHQNPNNSV